MRESMWKAGCEEGTAAARKARTGRTDAIDSHQREHPYTRMSRADVGRYLAGDLTLVLLLGWLFYDSLVSVIELFRECYGCCGSRRGHGAGGASGRCNGSF